MEQPLDNYITLESIVSMAMDEENKSFADFDRAWIFGLRGLQKLNQSISAEPATVRLPVLSNQTVPFPSDCLSWVKIGIMDNDGKVSVLTVNNALTTFRDTNPQRLQNLTADVNDNIGSLTSSPIFINYFNNSTFFNLYGTRTGLITYGECRVDEKNRVVILSPNFQYDSILFEYISNPARNPNFMVNSLLQEPIIAFIKWKLKTGTRQDFYGEVTESRRSLPNKKVTLQRIQEVIRESVGMKLLS